MLGKFTPAAANLQPLNSITTATTQQPCRRSLPPAYTPQREHGYQTVIERESSPPSQRCTDCQSIPLYFGRRVAPTLEDVVALWKDVYDISYEKLPVVCSKKVKALCAFFRSTEADADTVGQRTTVR
jgi:hypothetical protein